MKILVSELAKLYGLTNQTIHYYEEKQMILPARDVLNNYRYFEALDLRRLGGIKKYRNADFSLGDAYKMCMDDTQSDIMDRLTAQRIEIQKEIDKKQFVMDQINEKITAYTRYKTGKQEYVIEEVMEQYILVSYEKEIIYQDEAFRKEATPWFQNIFFTEAISIYEFNSAHDSYTKIAYGMAASEKVFQFLKLKKTNNVRKIEKGLCLTYMTSMKEKEAVDEELKRAKAYLNTTPYKLRDLPLVKTIIASKDDENDYELFVEIILPIL